MTIDPKEDNLVGEILRWVLLCMTFGTLLMVSGLAWTSSWQSGAIMLPIGIGSLYCLRLFLRCFKRSMRTWTRTYR